MMLIDINKSEQGRMLQVGTSSEAGEIQSLSRRNSKHEVQKFLRKR